MILLLLKIGILPELNLFSTGIQDFSADIQVLALIDATIYNRKHC